MNDTGLSPIIRLLLLGPWDRIPKMWYYYIDGIFQMIHSSYLLSALMLLEWFTRLFKSQYLKVGSFWPLCNKYIIYKLLQWWLFHLCPTFKYFKEIRELCEHYWPMNFDDALMHKSDVRQKRLKFQDIWFYSGSRIFK